MRYLLDTHTLLWLIEVASGKLIDIPNRGVKYVKKNLELLWWQAARATAAVRMNTLLDARSLQTY